MRKNWQICNSNGRIKERFSEAEYPRKQRISKGKTTTISRDELKSLAIQKSNNCSCFGNFFCLKNNFTHDIFFNLSTSAFLQYHWVNSLWEIK